MLIKVKKLHNKFLGVCGTGLTQQDLFDIACRLTQPVSLYEDSLICEIMEHTEEIIYNVISENHDIDDIRKIFTTDEKWKETNYILYE